MIFVALDEAASKGELLVVEGGLCRFHKLRDGSVTIREILVLPKYRRRRVGFGLVAQVLGHAAGRVVRARCPVAYEGANAFWEAAAFTLVRTVDGVNLWERPHSG